MSCFDLSGFLCPSQSVKVQYQIAWATFNKVQNFNSNVSTLHARGNPTPSFYTFLSFGERNMFLQGQYLHYQIYPLSNWNAIQ